MADHDISRHMSLIPYPSTQGEVVLRHGDAVVIRDPQSQQLTLRDARTDTVEYGKCPYCHRPYQEGEGEFNNPRPRERPRTDRGFVNPDYFRMLADRTPVSASSTRPPSPGRPLRALRSGGSRNVSESGPPTGAEFVGSSPAPQNVDQGIKGRSFLPGYFNQFFVEKRVLGKGGRGVVLLVEHVLDGINCGDFACKRIPVGNDHDWLAKVLVEVQLLVQLDHPNLVSYRHVWLEDAQTTKFGPSVPCVFILQQFCNGGDLHDYVQDPSRRNAADRERQQRGTLAKLMTRSAAKPMSLDEIFSFFKNIVSGLDYLHSKGYIHRDLKPSNCLLHRVAGKITVHLSDFGEVQAATAQRNSTGATGTISYCAPEVLQRESEGGAYGNFTTKSDVFSLGMILYYMCFGTLPYQNADIKEQNEDLDLLRAEITAWPGLMKTERRRRDLPQSLYDFLAQLLSIDPTKRPNTAEILQHLRHGGGLGQGMVEIIEEGVTSEEDTSRPQQNEFRRRISRSGISQIPPASGHRGASVADDDQPRSPIVDRGVAKDHLKARHRDSEDLNRDAFSSARDPESPNPGAANDLALSIHRSRGHSDSVRQSPSGRRSSSADENWHETLSGRGPQRRRSSLLLLPPPSETTTSRVLRRIRAPTVTGILKVVALGAKLISLTLPCRPYATNPLVAIPLFALVAIDLALISSWRISALLLAVHFIIVQVASTNLVFCEGWVYLSSFSDSSD